MEKENRRTSVLLALMMLLVIVPTDCGRDDPAPQSREATAKEVSSADAATNRFHELLDAKQFKELCRNAEPKAFGASTGVSCYEFLSYVHDTLGTVRTSRQLPGRVVVEVSPSKRGVRFSVPYQTEFERGAAREEFTWLLPGNGAPRLLIGVITSEALLQ